MTDALPAHAELDVFTCPLDGVNQIEASAGTGKTWNICALYVRLLLEKDLRADQILVVTFTKAATAELHERIRSRLAQLEYVLDHGAGEAADDPFIRQLFATTLSTAGGTLETALKRIRRALRGFDQAAIHTIHAFCQRALQEAPFAAAMPFKLELANDDERLRLDVAGDFWRTRVEPLAALDHGFAAWLVRKRAGPPALGEQLARRLKKPLAQLRWDGTSEVRPDAAAAIEARARFAAAAALWEAESAALDALLAAARPSLNQRSHKPLAVRAAQQAWHRYFADGDYHALPPKDALKLTAAALKSATKAKGQTPQHPFFELAQTLADAAGEAQASHEARWLGLLRAFLAWAPDELQARKRALRVMSFDDLLANLHGALLDHAWLADALRARYPAALIDEFQDTDPLQFDIFKRIFAPAGPLFLVGDPKQAIYSFRAADLHTYLQARDHASARYTLAVNQRSTAPIIAACNRLFAANPAAFVLEGLAYQPVRAGERQRAPLHDPAGVLAEAPEAGLRVWLLPGEAGHVLPKRAAERAAAQACAAEIARLLRAARAGAVRIGAAPLAPAQVAVLVQTHRQGSLVKRVLSGWGVGSVELAQASVFGSFDAEQIERVLLAIDTPGDPRRLRAALATDWIGLDAAALWQLDRHLEQFEAVSRPAPASAAQGRAGIQGGAAQESDATPWVERFTRYRALWHERGFVVMWRTLLRELRVAQRLAAGPEGERRLTNLSHLAELIQARAAEQPGIAPVLRWLAAQRTEPGGGEEAQLRLESDRDLVQIVTVHKAKGLEYAVVFCPFLMDGTLHAARPSSLPQAREYRQARENSETPETSGTSTTGSTPATAAGDAVLHYGCDAALSERAARDALREQAAERARLIYVALTRAVYRCYVVGGVYGSGPYASTKQASQSMLNWLVAGAGRTFDDWQAEPAPAAEILARWQALDGADIAVRPLPPEQRPTPLVAESALAGSLRARHAGRPLRDTWRIASFSSLVAQGAREGAAPSEPRPDHDASAAAALPEALAPGLITARATRREPDDIIDFPRGAAAGECLHRMFELADFSSAAAWPTVIARALHERPLPAPAALAARLPAMMARTLADVCATELQPGMSLAALDPAHRLNELEFLFPAAALDLSALRRLLDAHGYADVALDAGSLRGYIKGFVDLVFEHGGRFWILDWKSNYLGESAADYGPAPLAAAMAGHAYHLQALLYTVALHRYLKLRLPGYDYATHFGGCLYLFIRGVRPGWRVDGAPAGVHAAHPGAALVEALDAMMTGAAP